MINTIVAFTFLKLAGKQISEVILQSTNFFVGPGFFCPKSEVRLSLSPSRLIPP